MVISDNKPKCEGWYWVDYGRWSKPIVVHVEPCSFGLGFIDPGESKVVWVGLDSASIRTWGPRVREWEPSDEQPVSSDNYRCSGRCCPGLPVLPDRHPSTCIEPLGDTQQAREILAGSPYGEQPIDMLRTIKWMRRLFDGVSDDAHTARDLLWEKQKREIADLRECSTKLLVAVASSAHTQRDRIAEALRLAIYGLDHEYGGRGDDGWLSFAAHQIRLATLLLDPDPVPF